MTIELQITNKDAARELEVIENHHSRPNQNRVFVSNPIVIKPGESRTFHVHLLRDLTVREVEP